MVECGRLSLSAKQGEISKIAARCQHIFLHSHPTPKRQRLNAAYLSLSNTDSKTGVTEKSHAGATGRAQARYRTTLSAIESMEPNRRFKLLV